MTMVVSVTAVVVMAGSQVVETRAVRRVTKAANRRQRGLMIYILESRFLRIAISATSFKVLRCCADGIAWLGS